MGTSHELAHAILTLKAYVNKPSIYHTQFRAIHGRSKVGIYNQQLGNLSSDPYNQDLNHQEIYAYTSNLILFSKDVINNIENIERTIYIIEMLNKGVQSFVDNLAQDFDVNH